MNSDKARAFREIVHTEVLAALGTLHNGEPFVSMVPYAQLPEGADFFVHVSRLASHTRDMLASPRVSLLIISSNGDSPQSRARVTVQGDAIQLDRASTDYEIAKACYIARFPDAAHIFELGDFSIFRITPVTARVVGGFAQAYSLDADSIASAFRRE